MEIRRGTNDVDVFMEINCPRGASILNTLYCMLAPDVNSLMGMLMPVVSEIILCPENGKWRFVANSSLGDDREVALFFPWLLPSGDGFKLQRVISIGLRGDVQLVEIRKVCQKVISAFEKTFFNALQVKLAKES